MIKDIVTLSKKELNRLPIIHKVMDKRMTQIKAAEILGLCERQIRRIIEKIKKGGVQAIAHGNRGRPSPRKMPQKEEQRIIAIVKKKYWDFGPTFAAEKLLENNEAKISWEKLRQLMIAADIWKPKKGILLNWA